MKRVVIGFAVLLAACSGGKAPDPAATETAAAAASATASASAASTDTPMTAERCIEDNKGLGTGVRGENTKDCMTAACDQGDKKSCDFVKSFSGEGDGNEPPADDEQGQAPE